MELLGQLVGYNFSEETWVHNGTAKGSVNIIIQTFQFFF
jgi:hypothetical protein